jgi:hypothetical protein
VFHCSHGLDSGMTPRAVDGVFKRDRLVRSRTGQRKPHIARSQLPSALCDSPEPMKLEVLESIPRFPGGF